MSSINELCQMRPPDGYELSDLDILVDPTPTTSLFDIGAIRFELKAMLHIEVDVLTPNALPDSFRTLVLAQAKPI